MKKVVAINGSPRKNGNTYHLLNKTLESIKAIKPDVECEIIETAQLKLEGCNACSACFRNKNMKCIINDDMNMIIEKMVSADAIILGTPTYFADVSSEMKAIIDRAGDVVIANDRALSRKIGASVVAVRRAGGIPAFNTMNNFFFINDMIVPGSTYWNVGIGLDKGDVNNDEEGIATVTRLGENIAWLLDKLS